MSSIKKMGAMESMFDPEQTTAALLDAVKVNVTKTVKTVDEATALENKLSDEAAQFNACLTTMSNAIRKCERGEISREEMLAECAPCVTALKDKCSALKLADVKTTGDDITEEEIAMLREYIVGCKDIVAAHKQELQDCPVTSAASEGVMSALYNFTPATEGISQAKEIRNSNDAKTANEVYKQAKKLYGLGSKEQAQKYLKQAQKLYEKCLAKAEKAGKMYTVDRILKGANVEDKFKKKVTDNMSIAMVIEYFEDRIDSCKALEMQWNNKAGKSTFKETKDQLKAERKATKKQNRLNAAKERAGKRASGKMSHSAKKFANAAYKEKMKAAKSEEEREAVESMFDLVEATEAFADDLLMHYDVSYALEAEGDEGEDVSSISPEEEKLRELYQQFNEAKGNGDEDEMNRLTGEIQKVIDKVSKEAADAYTEEDLKAADRKLAKCLGIGAAVIAAGAAVAVGVKSGAFNKVVEGARAQATKLKESKGKNKSETNKAKALISHIKTTLGGLKGKIKLGKKGAASEAMIDGMSYEEFDASMESLMDSMELELAVSCAMEAEGEDGEEGSTKSASGIGAKLRAAFGKLKRAKKTGNTSEEDAAVREVNAAVDELADAAADAETPEEKQKLSKAAKIGLAAAATVAATVGLTTIASKASKAADAKADRGFELNKVEQLLRSSTSAIKSAKGTVQGAAVTARNNVGDAVSRGVQHHRNKQLAKNFGKSAFGKVAKESFLASMAFGLEGVTIDGEDPDDDETEPMEGKGFDDEAQGTDMIDDAVESDLAIEATIAVMMAEDGIDDSDLY